MVEPEAVADDVLLEDDDADVVLLERAEADTDEVDEADPEVFGDAVEVRDAAVLVVS